MPGRKANNTSNSKKAASRKANCAVCQQPVVDEKDEALLCEANCQLWYHRGCASVPPKVYQTLADSDEPFICLYCTCIQLKEQVRDLSSTVTVLREELKKIHGLEDLIGKLSDEVAELRKDLEQ